MTKREILKAIPSTGLIASLLILAIGCAPKATTSLAPTTVTPASPADIVAQANDAVAKAASAAVNTTISLAQTKDGSGNPVISSAEEQRLLNYIKPFAAVSQQIAQIQASNPSWAAEKPQIIALIPTVPGQLTGLSQNAQNIAATIAVVWASFQTALTEVQNQ